MAHHFGLGRIKKPVSGEDFVRMMQEHRNHRVNTDTMPEPPEGLKEAFEDAVEDLKNRIDNDTIEQFTNRIKEENAKDFGVHPLEFHRQVQRRLDKILVEYENFFNYVVQNTNRVYESESLGKEETTDLFTGCMHRFFDALEELEHGFYTAGEEAQGVDESEEG